MAPPAHGGPPSTEVDAASDHADAAAEAVDARPPIDPEVSRRWSWHRCGTLSPAPADSEAVFGVDDTLVVRGKDGATRVYDDTGARRPGADETVDFLIAAPDGTPAGGTVTPTSLVIRPIGAATARFTFSLPSSTSCGHNYAFSPTGDLFLAHGGGPSCVWRVDTGAFVAGFPDDAPQAAIRGSELATLQTATDRWVDLVTRDFSGRETSRVRLQTRLAYPGDALLSPAGDRVASTEPSTLWDSDGHALVVVPRTAAEPSAVPPVFTAAGERLMLANGVFRSADGTRSATLAPLSRIYGAQWRTLSPDGRRVIASDFGRASLFEVSAPGFSAMLGPPVLRDGHSGLPTLAISANSVLVALFDGVAFGIRLAPRLEDSPTLWDIWAGDFASVAEISADGRWASAAGDNRALFSAVDGRVAWPSPPPPAGVRCLGSRLGLSPDGQWAAGASYLGTMDVFSLGDSTRPAWSSVTTLSTECLGAAAFSRDGRLLATSAPAFFRLDATGTTWNEIWSHFAGSSGSAAELGNAALRIAPWTDVRFSPDERTMLVSRCDVGQPDRCAATLYDTANGDLVRNLSALTAPRPSFSPDGSWVVAGATLLHLPSNDTRPIAQSLSTHAALFTPDGDIVAGTDDGALVRYCRDP